jgi:hypothetical protein
MTTSFHDGVETRHRPAITAPSGVWRVVVGGVDVVVVVVVVVVDVIVIEPLSLPLRCS